MTEEPQLNNIYEKVTWLVQNVPETKTNFKLLILLYWQMFDEIDIPAHLITDIMEKGSEPESISRLKRKCVSLNQLYEDLADIINEEDS